MRERGEQRLVEQLVAQPTVKTFDEGVLDRFARGDVMPVDLHPLGEAQDGVRGELGAVVADDHCRLPAPGDERFEFARHPQSRQRSVGDQGKAFPRAVVDDGQDAEAAAVGELVRDEVE